MAQYVAANRELTLKGHIVYTVAAMSSAAVETQITDDEKIVLDLVHLRKILESDAVVLITDETRYIGFSTKRELQWAQLIGKRIYAGPEHVGSSFYFKGDPRG